MTDKIAKLENTENLAREAILVADFNDELYENPSVMDPERDLDRIFSELDVFLAENPQYRPLAQERLSQRFSSAAASEPERLPLPTEAPELYKSRSDKSEKPADFILRVYGSWMTQPGGLPRPVLREIDEAAYRALYKHGIPDDFETLLPTAQGRALAELSLTDAEILASRRARNAAAQRAFQEKKKNKIIS